MVSFWHDVTHLPFRIPPVTCSLPDDVIHCSWFVACFNCQFLSLFFFFWSFPFVMHHWNLLRCSFAAFSAAQRDSCCASSWRTRIDPDHQCRDATALSLVDQLSQCVRTYRFFLDGVGLCKQRSCIHRICHALSFDLSGQWTSLDLIWWEEWWIQFHPWRRALGPVIGFHQHLLRHLHQPYHILHLLALPLHHAHPLCHVHQHNHAPRALHQSLHLSLVHLRLLNLPPQEVQNIMKPPAPMGSISILIGKRIKTTTTIKKSTVWPSHAAFVKRLLFKSWTLKGVILCAYQWRLCCINKLTTSGFESWLMVVNFTWSLQGTSQQLCSRQNSWRSSETKESTWQGLPLPGWARWQTDGQD